MMKSNHYKVIVNSISAHVAILDEHGTILETNRAWQEFAKHNGMTGSCDCVGLNYLDVCEKAPTHQTREGLTVARGIRSVLQGEIPEFLSHYPCHSPEEKRWFTVRAVPLRNAGNNHVIVTHENITPIIEIQNALEMKEKELQNERERLQETNIALRVLLRQREEDKTRIEQTIYTNIDRLVLPYLEQLRQGRMSERQHTLTEVIDTSLREIISPFLRNLSTLALLLTPQETEVANMVRRGERARR